MDFTISRKLNKMNVIMTLSTITHLLYYVLFPTVLILNHSLTNDAWMACNASSILFLKEPLRSRIKLIIREYSCLIRLHALIFLNACFKNSRMDIYLYYIAEL